MSDEAYALSLAPAARRVLVEGPPRGLPAAVAAAVTEFLTGALLDKPHRVGKPLARELAKYHSARRGAYRVATGSTSPPGLCKSCASTIALTCTGHASPDSTGGVEPR